MPRSRRAELLLLVAVLSIGLLIAAPQGESAATGTGTGVARSTPDELKPDDEAILKYLRGAADPDRLKEACEAMRAMSETALTDALVSAAVKVYGSKSLHVVLGIYSHAAADDLDSVVDGVCGSTTAASATVGTNIAAADGRLEDTPATTCEDGGLPPIPSKAAFVRKCAVIGAALEDVVVGIEPKCDRRPEHQAGLRAMVQLGEAGVSRNSWPLFLGTRGDRLKEAGRDAKDCGEAMNDGRTKRLLNERNNLAPTCGKYTFSCRPEGCGGSLAGVTSAREGCVSEKAGNLIGVITHELAHTIHFCNDPGMPRCTMHLTVYQDECGEIWNQIVQASAHDPGGPIARSFADLLCKSRSIENFWTDTPELPPPSFPWTYE